MRRSSTAVVLLAGCLLIGCDRTPKPHNSKKVGINQPQEVVDFVVDALKKEGIDNPPAAIFDDDAYWTVTLTPDGVGPDGKMTGPPKQPETVIVDKKTKKVIRPASRGSRGEGKSDGVLRKF